MVDYVQFYVHCSRTKQRYIVSGYIENNILVWAAAFVPLNGTRPNNTPLQNQTYDTIYVTAFRCPCCETPGINNGTPHTSWICQVCGAQHCMGMDNAGNCHGACGSCVHPRSSFSGRVPTVIQVATFHDR